MSLADLNMKQQLLDDKAKELSGKQDRVKNKIRMQEAIIAEKKRC